MIPKDIKQVVERLILRGSIKRPDWSPSVESKPEKISARSGNNRKRQNP